MAPFNNRELAIAFWLVLLAVWALRKPEIRKSIVGVFRAFWRVKIVVPVCLMLLYVSCIVVLLEAIGMWKIHLLKDTVVWFFVGAMAMMMRFATAEEAGNIFSKIFSDSIKIVILLEFLVNTYIFPFVVELILVPLLTFIAMIDVVASMNEEHAIVARVAQGIQIVAGLVILVVAINLAVSDFQNLKSLDTFRSIALAPLMSVLMFPFIYILIVFSKYELLFIRLDFGSEKTRSLERYARHGIMMYAGLSLKRLQYLLGNHIVDIMHVQTESDVDRFLEQARRANTSAAEG